MFMILSGSWDYVVAIFFFQIFEKSDEYALVLYSTPYR